MPLIFDCPACGKELSAPDTAAGAAGVCKFCQASLIAPAGPGQPASLTGPAPGVAPGPSEAPFAAPPYAPPGYSQPGYASGFATPEEVLWRLGDPAKRIVAFLVDGLFLSLVVWFLAGAMGINPLSGYRAGMSPMEMQSWAQSQGPVMLRVSGVSLLLYVLYGSLLESSAWRATLGKRLLGLQVTDVNGNPITLGKAVLRNVVKWAPSSIPFCCIGCIWPFTYLVAFFTDRRQALHDMAATTLVLDAR